MNEKTDYLFEIVINHKVDGGRNHLWFNIIGTDIMCALNRLNTNDGFKKLEDAQLIKVERLCKVDMR